jgi:uncharacterized protein YbjT (DUF2867 family)
MPKDTILVTGATGKIGSALVSFLAADAAQPVIRVATRNVNSDAARLLQAMNPASIELVEFNESQPESVQSAFAGVTKLAVISPITPDMVQWHAQLGAAAKAAGVEYIVKVSVTGARSPENDPPPGRLPLLHWQSEEALRQTGLPITAIRPTIFMQHFLTNPGLYKRGASAFYLPTGATKVAFLDCRDIARMLAALVTADAAKRREFEGQSYELTGPAGVSAPEIAQILGWVAGREIAHVDGEEAFVARCAELGVPDGIKAIYKEAKDGWFGATEFEAYTRATGQIPTSFAKFALDNAAYFKG